MAFDTCKELPQSTAGLAGNSGFATSLGLLLIRLSLGSVFFIHGAQKLFGWWGGKGLSVFASYLHLPVLPQIVWASMAAGAEFFCGLLVFVGLLTRLATLPLIVTMWVAIWTVHGPHGYVSTSGMGYEYHVALIAMSGLLLLTGPGLVSADAYLFPRGFWSLGAQPMRP